MVKKNKTERLCRRWDDDVREDIKEKSLKW